MNTKYPLIDKYFEGSLTAEELQEFEKLKQKSPEFLAALNYQKDVAFAIQSKQRENLKKELQIFEKENFNTTKTIKKQWLLVASIALLVISLGYFFTIQNTTINTKELYASNFEPYENVIHPILRDTTTSIKNDAFIAYEKKEYKKAVTLFAKVYAATKQEDILFYKAMALLASKQSTQAVSILEKYSSKNTSLQVEAYWYLALAHLELNNTKKAIFYLEKVKNIGSFKVNEVIILLEKL